MAYSHIQFIAYEIGTSPVNVPSVSPTKRYPGIPNFDVQARCDLMSRAMETALANLPVSAPPPEPGTTLKVFLAPEFYFRGPDGAYSMDEVQQVVSLLQGLAADDKWVDWVFGFGTILGVSAPAVGSPPVIDFAAAKEAYNFTLLQKGGVASSGHPGARVVMKELKSGIDFIAVSANPNAILDGSVEHLGPSRAGGPGREQQRVNYDGAGIFSLDGITWGVEICLDHLDDVARLQRSPQLPGASEVQVQLVPSGGMSIQAPSIIAATGGYVFNVDGIDHGSSELQQVALPPVTIPGLPPVPVPAGAVDVTEASPLLSVPVTDLFANGPGVICYYGVQVLPPATQVKGTVNSLKWDASPAYQIRFDLIYDETGTFKTLLCEPISRKVDFQNLNYFLPLTISAFSQAALAAGNPTEDVYFDIELKGGTEGFSHAVWCTINTPEFDFQGNAMLFNDKKTSLPPRTVW